LKYLTSFILFVALFPCGVVHSDAGGRPETTPPRKTVLPNGMTVILQEDHSSRVVAASAFVKFGSPHESAETAGARYFLQQMLLRGTARRSAEQIEEELASIGAGMDVTVGDDYVELFATGAGASVEYLITLMAEVLTEPRFDPQEVEKVRKNILLELEGLQDNIRLCGYQALRESLYRDADGELLAYALPPMGEKSSIERIEPAQLRHYWQTYFVPDNMVISLVGDMDSARTLELVERAFGSLPGQNVLPSPQLEIKPLEDCSLTVREQESDAAWLLVGYALPPVANPDIIPLRVASALLGEGMGSLLYQDLRNRQGIAYEAAANFTPRLEACELLIYLQTNPLDIELAKERVFAQITALQTAPVEQATLRRAVEYAAGTFALSHLRTRERAWHYALFETLGVGYEFDLHYAEKLRQVTAADVQRVCREYLRNPAVVLVMPSVW